MNRIISLVAAIAGTATSVTSAAAGEVSARPIAVVELFTSQGCANCPPADAFLSELARENDVVALSYAVDYWDYMGWKDTAAKPEFALRQKGYAGRRGDRDVFTPQVIVNGRTQVVGSDREKIRREISLGAEMRRDLAVAVDVESTADAVKVHLPSTKAGEPVHATVLLVRYDHSRSVAIGRGENTGRTLTYAHLVRSILPIGMWKGQELTLELPRQETPADPNLGCAVLVQQEKDGLPGPILGARACSAQSPS